MGAGNYSIMCIKATRHFAVGEGFDADTCDESDGRLIGRDIDGMKFNRSTRHFKATRQEPASKKSFIDETIIFGIPGIYGEIFNESHEQIGTFKIIKRWQAGERGGEFTLNSIIATIDGKFYECKQVRLMPGRPIRLIKTCCEKEDRGMNGGCKNCGDPCL